MLAFSNDYYGLIFRATQSVELFCAYETTLPIAIKHDVKYQKAQKKCNKANEKIRDLNLTPQQWDTVDAAITAENISSIEYIRIAYKQGIIDAFSILRETL